MLRIRAIHGTKTRLKFAASDPHTHLASPHLHQALTDKEYAAAMLELERRRNASILSLPPDRRESAVFLRDALLTHMELSKRDAKALGSNPAAAGVARVSGVGDTNTGSSPGKTLMPSGSQPQRASAFERPQVDEGRKFDQLSLQRDPEPAVSAKAGQPAAAPTDPINVSQFRRDSDSIQPRRVGSGVVVDAEEEYDDDVAPYSGPAAPNPISDGGKGFRGTGGWTSSAMDNAGGGAGGDPFRRPSRAPSGAQDLLLEGQVLRRPSRAPSGVSSIGEGAADSSPPLPAPKSGAVGDGQSQRPSDASGYGGAGLTGSRTSAGGAAAAMAGSNLSSPRSGGYGSSSPLNQSIGRYGAGAVSAAAVAAAASGGLNASLQRSTRSSITGITPPSPLDQSLKRQAEAAGAGGGGGAGSGLNQSLRRQAEAAGGGAAVGLNQSLSRRIGDASSILGPPSPSAGQAGGGSGGGGMNQSFGRPSYTSRPPAPVSGGGGALGVQVRILKESIERVIYEGPMW